MAELDSSVGVPLPEVGGMHRPLDGRGAHLST